MDIILSLCAVAALSPVLLGVSILVKIRLGSPVIFKQKRPGLNEKIFTLYKFRTMTDEKDENGRLLPDKMRLTAFGKWLRSTSLDELPELFNILKGDMSIIGPRPQLVKDMVFMTSEQRRRHSVSPGLSGLAQINGRNNMAWEEKLTMDLKYIENIIFLCDVKILLMTFARVFRHEGISTEGMVTAEDFADYLLRIGKIDQDIYRDGIEKSQKILRS